MNWKILALLGLFSLVIVACGDNEDPQPEPETCETEGMTYDNDIKAIFDTNCTSASCHNDTDLAKGFTLQNYTAAAGAASFGNFLPSINQESGVVPMPIGADKLDQCDIDKIAAWIADGRPE